ncbi:hypothetical protein [Cohnella sp. AR92]|uniref:hypothetical protein n=1 Tax=Cohnella sp. AR92 TaxID=648716 RepID=UPI000F8F6A5A|nr:hypothetical protein [Cohnella sp. AR92]RUS45825.1 hypothetical protein ELR57_18410 [Cohnella sp. AR92]
MPILSEPLAIPANPQLQEPRIGSMEIFLYEHSFIRDHLPGTPEDWNCGLFKISSGGCCGWEEFRLPPTAARIDLIRFASVFRSLKKLSVADAYVRVQTHGSAWGSDRQQLAEAALLSLALQLQHKKPSPDSRSSAAERALLFDCSQAYFSF